MVHPRCVRKYNKEYQRYQIGQTQHFTSVVFDLSDIFDILCYRKLIYTNCDCCVLLRQWLC